jgi:hypothetical protein
LSELAPVAGTFEELSCGVPSGTASKVGAAVVQDEDFCEVRFFQEPSAGFGHVERDSGPESTQRLFGDLTRFTLARTKQDKPTDAPRGHGSDYSRSEENRVPEEGAFFFGKLLIQEIALTASLSLRGRRF